MRVSIGGGTLTAKQKRGMIESQPTLSNVVAALGPFAAMADFYACFSDDYIVLFGIEGNVTVGDIRRARDILGFLLNGQRE